MSKTVLITGASRGIGFALAQQFLSHGYLVIGTSRTGKAMCMADFLLRSLRSKYSIS